MNRQIANVLLKIAPVLLLLAVIAFFASRTGKFLDARNLLNIIAQASSTGILAIGMTFVLITAGVDLSVGALMFIGATVAGKLALAGQDLSLCLAAMLVTTLAAAALNAFVITRIRVAPFIVTLATLFIWRGLSLRITETRAMNLPGAFLEIGSASFAGIPVPVWLFVITAIAASLVLGRTPFGRQALAIGHNVEAARKAGIRVNRVTAAVYLVSGFCAAIAAAITMGQLGTVSPMFGEGREFAAIAAAVLGGTSIFGGRGNVWGACIGAILIQTLENGLVMLDTDPYMYRMVISGVILLAVLLESARNRATTPRRLIRPT